MRSAAGLAVLLILTQSLAAAPFSHSSGEWREYHRDWLAACPSVIDEDGTDFYSFSCFASTGSPELNGAGLPAYKLTLMRNRLDGEIDLAITIAPEQGEYDTSRPIGLAFGGEPAYQLAFGDDLEIRYNTTNQFFVIGPHRDALLQKMEERNALNLSVPLVGREKLATTRLSLRGVLASLDFMSTHARRVSQY